MRPTWMRRIMGSCYCDPDRLDVFARDCPTHGIPHSVRDTVARQRAQGAR